MLSGQRLISLKIKAVSLRRKGYSYSLIHSRLSVSKSTLSGWLRDMPYKPNQEVLSRIEMAAAKSAEVLKQRRLKMLRSIKKAAEEELGVISRRDLWMLGIGLYIGEGSKSNKAGVVRIVNSNPKVIKLAMKWFRDVCSLKMDNFKLAVHIYPDCDVEQSQIYWSKVTGIPLLQFGKIYVDKRKKKFSQNRRKLSYGTAHLSIRANGKKEFGVNLLRRIDGWSQAVIE